MKTEALGWRSEFKSFGYVPEELKELISSHSRQVESLRGDVDKWGTSTDLVRLARFLSRLARLYCARGDNSLAVASMEEANALFRKCDKVRAFLLNRGRLAVIRRYMNEPEVARRLFDELLQQKQAEYTRPYRTRFLVWRSHVLGDLGDRNAARVDLLQAQEIEKARKRTNLAVHIDRLLVELG